MTATRTPNLRTRSTVLLDQLRELLAAVDAGEVPGGPAYRHRVEGGITALEAVLDVPPSLGGDVLDLAAADGLLVGKLDRLARQLTMQEAILAMIWRVGSRAFSADQGEILRDDPDDPMRTALRQVQGVFAQLDRAMITKRLRDGRRAKAATGRHAVGQYRYGFEGAGRGRTRDAAPRTDEQAAVARIVELRTAGESYRAIAAKLDAEGHRPRRAAAWSAMAVRSVAQRAMADSSA